MAFPARSKEGNAWYNPNDMCTFESERTFINIPHLSKVEWKRITVNSIWFISGEKARNETI